MAFAKKGKFYQNNIIIIDLNFSNLKYIFIYKIEIRRWHLQLNDEISSKNQTFHLLPPKRSWKPKRFIKKQWTKDVEGI